MNKLQKLAESGVYHRITSESEDIKDSIYINELDGDGISLLHRSAASGNCDYLRFFIEIGGDILQHDQNLHDAFDIALDAHNFRYCDMLLDKKIAIDPRPSGYGSLDYPAMQNDTESLRYLLKNGADINGKYSGNTPLMWAIQQHATEAVALLLTSGADPNLGSDFGDFPLRSASSDGNLVIVRLLLAAGADPQKADGEGVTSRDVALAYGHDVVARLLAERL